MPPPGGSIDDKVENAPSMGEHLAYGAPPVAGGLAAGGSLGLLAYNYVRNIGYGAFLGGAAAGLGGVLGYVAGRLAIGSVMALVSKGARKYFGIGKAKPEGGAKGPPMR